MENRFWFCDRFRRFRRRDDGVPYACESYARPSGDVSHGFLREVERRRRGNTPFTQLSQQSFCELGMKGCKRIQKNCATGLCTLLRSLVFYPWPQVLDGPSANLDVPFASHCDTRTIRVLGELAITLPVKDRTICRRAL